MELSVGKNITQKQDKLFKIPFEHLVHSIKKPKTEIAEKIKQLRTIQNISVQEYRKLKVHLPYVVAAQFNPPYRLSANFTFTQHFILDIDHFSDDGKDINELKHQLKSDPNIKLIFVSPGGNGLKVFFELSEKCYDKAKYSLFYKTFALQFAGQYNLKQSIDLSTSDVTRACFISYDADLYYNPDNLPLIMSDFLDFNQLSEIRKQEKQLENIEKKQEKTKPQVLNPIDDEKLLEIKKKLNPNIRTRKPKQIYVPPELEKIIDDVEQLVNKHQISIEKISNIHYGKKFNFVLDNKKAEINLFYGKKGFTVVKSPKSGTNPELNDICYQLLCSIFY